jgi:hypothetical protein
VAARPGTDLEALRSRLLDRLRRFLDPLEGGPEGGGWPFGRDVYRSEVLQALDETAGVEHVLSLELAGDGGESQCANLCLGPLGLPFSGDHRIEVVGYAH